MILTGRSADTIPVGDIDAQLLTDVQAEYRTPTRQHYKDPSGRAANDAASIAGHLLTTECVIADRPEMGDTG